jgi:hypothetical protein
VAWWVLVVVIELAVTALAGATFMILYGVRAEWVVTPLGRHLMAFALIGTLDAGALLLLATGVILAPWQYVLLYGAGAALTIQRVAIFLGVQRVARRQESPVPTRTEAPSDE